MVTVPARGRSEVSMFDAMNLRAALPKPSLHDQCTTSVRPVHGRYKVPISSPMLGYLFHLIYLFRVKRDHSSPSYLQPHGFDRQYSVERGEEALQVAY